MGLIEINWQPSNRILRQFGSVLTLLTALLCWFVTIRNDWLILLGATVVISSLITIFRPRILLPAFCLCSLLTFPLGMIIGEIAMLAIYYCVITPIGFALKVTGQVAVTRKIDRKTESYWEKRMKRKGNESYFRRY